MTSQFAKYPLSAVLLLLMALTAACAEDPQDEAAAQSGTTEIQTADAEMEVGKRVFSSCASCHSTSDGGFNTVGPNLSGVLGTAAGSKQGFEYSEALRNSAVVWNEESLDRYIEDPAAMIPGGTMAFPGVKDAAERKAVLAYLIAQTAGGDSDPSVPSSQGDDVAVWE